MRSPRFVRFINMKLHGITHWSLSKSFWCFLSLFWTVLTISVMMSIVWRSAIYAVYLMQMLTSLHSLPQLLSILELLRTLLKDWNERHFVTWSIDGGYVRLDFVQIVVHFEKRWFGLFEWYFMLINDNSPNNEWNVEEVNIINCSLLFMEYSWLRPRCDITRNLGKFLILSTTNHAVDNGSSCRVLLPT